MKIRNKYLYRSHISEKKSREILECFCEDLDATKTASFTNIQRKTISQIFRKIRYGCLNYANRKINFQEIFSAA